MFLPSQLSKRIGREVSLSLQSKKKHKVKPDKVLLQADHRAFGNIGTILKIFKTLGQNLGKNLYAYLSFNENSGGNFK